MESKIIQKFCQTLDTKLLNHLSRTAQKLLIDACYTSLFQKHGKEEIAVKVLEHFGEIKRVSDSFVYTGDFDFFGYQSLKRIGVVTIPVIPPKEIPDVRKQFLETLRQFPEYNRNVNNPDLDSAGNPLVYVLGGFAALGNPASFHNPLVRDLRRRCREAVLPLFQVLIGRYTNEELRDNTNFEMLIDRMMYRLVSQQPSAESWHRDVMPREAIEENDEVFGGWINLDETNQYFSFIPGSHLGVRLKELEKGFATIPKEQVNIIGKYRHKFPVPPGHIVIFPQYILHEVVSEKSKHDMMRLFTGWRTTISRNYLHTEMSQLLQKQAIIPLPGGMQPPMYAANHGMFFLWKQFKPIPKDNDYKVNTIEWSNNTMQPRTLVERPANKDKPAYKILTREMRSLQYYGFPKYPEYTKEELKLYRPTRI